MSRPTSAVTTGMQKESQLLLPESLSASEGPWPGTLTHPKLKPNLEFDKRSVSYFIIPKSILSNSSNQQFLQKGQSPQGNRHCNTQS